MKKLIFLLFLLVFAAAACTQKPMIGGQEELMDCSPYEGADICIMEYNPVCAKLATGEWRTFGNACTACISDEEVVGYRMGEC